MLRNKLKSYLKSIENAVLEIEAGKEQIVPAVIEYHQKYLNELLEMAEGEIAAAEAIIAAVKQAQKVSK
jgi:glutamine synthetase type III